MIDIVLLIALMLAAACLLWQWAERGRIGK